MKPHTTAVRGIGVCLIAMGFSVLFGFGGPSVAGAFCALPLMGLGAAIVVFPHQAAEMWQRDVELASMSRGALQFCMWCAVGAGVTGLCGLVLGYLDSADDPQLILGECRAALPRMHNGSVVLIDDSSVTIPRRMMELLADHSIGRGAAGCERWWFIESGDAGPELVLCGEHGPVCRLGRVRGGLWRGRWLRFEAGEVALFARPYA